MPTYDRRALSAGVVHMSVGSFHRSHQAVYLDNLARRGERDWGIIGVGLRRAALERPLARQDGLYTVVSRGARESAAQVVGAFTRYLLAPRDTEAILDSLTDERTELVTLTITGKAYDITEVGSQPAHTGAPSPPGAIAYLVEALNRRRIAGRPPFTVLSCDNLPGNGTVAQMALVSFARLRDDPLADWIEEHVAFPNSMVDRITPRPGLTDHEAVAREFGVLDACPVITEGFSQWVLEDRFSNRRPPLEDVGVQFVDDVAPYALMKTRLLNASHCAIGFLGAVAGLRRTDEAMREPVFRAYVQRLMDEDVTPLLPPVPGVDLASYKRTLMERLANPTIGDDLRRLCRAGSSKVPSHVLSSIVEARERGVKHRLLTLAVAGWLRYLRGFDERGERLLLDDPLASRLRSAAIAGGNDPRPLLCDRTLFGALVDDSGFADLLEDALVDLERDGVLATLATTLRSEQGVAA